MHHRYPEGLNSYLTVKNKNMIYIFHEHRLIRIYSVNNDAINTKCYYHQIITTTGLTEPIPLVKLSAMKLWPASAALLAVASALLLQASAAGAPVSREESVRTVVTGIISYTRWPHAVSHPRLCIYASAGWGQALSQGTAQHPLPYIPVRVKNNNEALAAQCHAIYFGNESERQQMQLIESYQSHPLLLIAEQDPQCLMGSAFCLTIHDELVGFSVNLDALARSGVRVSPDVLMLARSRTPHNE